MSEKKKARQPAQTSSIDLGPLGHEFLASNSDRDGSPMRSNFQSLKTKLESLNCEPRGLKPRRGSRGKSGARWKDRRPSGKFFAAKFSKLIFLHIGSEETS